MSCTNWIRQMRPVLLSKVRTDSQQLSEDQRKQETLQEADQTHPDLHQSAARTGSPTRDHSLAATR